MLIGCMSSWLFRSRAWARDEPQTTSDLWAIVTAAGVVTHSCAQRFDKAGVPGSREHANCGGSSCGSSISRRPRPSVRSHSRHAIPYALAHAAPVRRSTPLVNRIIPSSDSAPRPHAIAAPKKSSSFRASMLNSGVPSRELIR